jgi:hypothetical protein
VNALAPGLGRTDLNATAAASDDDPAEAGACAVRLALLPDNGPSGEFFSWDGTPVLRQERAWSEVPLLYYGLRPQPLPLQRSRKPHGSDLRPEPYDRRRVALLEPVRPADPGPARPRRSASPAINENLSRSAHPLRLCQ